MRRLGREKAENNPEEKEHHERRNGSAMSMASGQALRISAWLEEH